MSRRKHQDEKRMIIGLSSIVLILLGIIIYTILIPLVVNWEIFSGKEYFADDSNRTTTSVPYLKSEEAVVLDNATTSETSTILPVEKVLFEYIEVTDGCGPHFEGECLRVRSGPGTDYPVVSRLRNGMVLKVGGKVENEGVEWYKIVFDEWLRYPERVKGDWYVVADYVKILQDEGDKTIWEHKPCLQNCLLLLQM